MRVSQRDPISVTLGRIERVHASKPIVIDYCLYTSVTNIRQVQSTTCLVERAPTKYQKNDLVCIRTCGLSMTSCADNR